MLPYWLISETESTSVLELYNSWMENVATRPLCMWVKIGNLYVSLTDTGETSWKHLVEHIYREENKKQFCILTGRHGDWTGGFGTDGAIVPKDKDREHYTQDLKMANQIERSLPGLDIVVEDVANGKLGTESRLKYRAELSLCQGSPVVFAWCFSIFALYQYDAKLFDTDMEQINKHAMNLASKSVHNIVLDKYGWVKRPIN